MTHNSPILIIRLSDDKKRYSIYLIDKDDTSYSYLPSKETKDISKSRKLIIENITTFLKYYIYCTPVSIKFSGKSTKRSIETAITQHHSPLKIITEFIGSEIFSNLGCEEFFRHLWEQKLLNANTDLIISTNDLEIPWEWAFNTIKKEFLCEGFSVGRIFLEDIIDYSSVSFTFFQLTQFQEALKQSEGLKYYTQPKKAIPNLQVALIYDSYEDDLINEIRLTIHNIGLAFDEVNKNKFDINTIKFITESLKKTNKLLSHCKQDSEKEKTILKKYKDEIEILEKNKIPPKSIKSGKLYPSKVGSQTKYRDFVKDEIKTVKKILQENAFKTENINEVSGQDQFHSKVIKKLFSKQWKKQKIIHFSLCGNGIEFYFANSKLKDSDIFPLPEAKESFFHYMPLVVLNIHGIEHGADYPLPYEPLAHKLLKMGASACLLTFLPIFDQFVPFFYEVFYSEIIENNASYGRALQIARNKLRDSVIKTPSAEDDVAWLFPILIGDPFLKLFQWNISTDAVLTSASQSQKTEDKYAWENPSIDQYFKKRGLLSLLDYLDVSIKGEEPEERILEFKKPWQAVEGIIEYLFHNYLGLIGDAWGRKKPGKPVPDGWVVTPKLADKMGWCFIYDCKSTTKEEVNLDRDIERQIEDYLGTQEVNTVSKKHDLKYVLIIGANFDYDKARMVSDNIYKNKSINVRFIDINNLKRLFLELDHNCEKVKHNIMYLDWDELFKSIQITKEKIQNLVKQFCTDGLDSRYQELSPELEEKIKTT